jgi:two-component system sensor histidine kinase KdpD
LLLNWFFTPPFHTFTIEERNNALALVVFVVVAAAVSSVVDLAARRTNQAARAAAEADTLSALAGSVLRGDSALPALLERLRETFGMSSVTLLERTDDGSPTWTVIESSGPPVTTPEQADADVPASERLVLALRGHPLSAADLRVVSAFAAQTALALEQRRLAQAAQAAQPIAEADRVRAALLTAVSHDLRTPLASAMAAVSSLRSNEVAWTEQETAELLATAEESLERLARLVANLLDMSRLQAGVLSVFPRPVALEDVVPAALDSLGPAGQSITVDVPDTLPPVVADPALLERVIANLAGNAIRYAPEDKPPHVTASALSDRVELRVADRGPGIPVAAREDVFAPFQRLGDTDNTVGVGLGLALARGLTEAMGGTVVPEDTPGGGLTMVVSLAAATPTVTTPRTPRDGRSGVDVR